MQIKIYELLVASDFINFADFFPCYKAEQNV